MPNPQITDDQVLALVQSRRDGKTIERSPLASDYWSVMDPREAWDFTAMKYRIQASTPTLTSASWIRFDQRKPGNGELIYSYSPKINRACGPFGWYDSSHYGENTHWIPASALPLPGVVEKDSKRLEVWVNEYRDCFHAHTTRGEAICRAGLSALRIAVHMIEVP